MTFSDWFIFFLLLQVIHFLGTWKLYVKAGRKPWEAILPIYNAVILMKMISRPKWWVILLFIPVVNLLMFPIIWIETIRTFGFYKKLDSFLVIITLGLYIFYVNYFTDAKYNKNRILKPRSELGEWISSITFAIIAATLVHTYFMQPFTIPTSSLEKTLLEKIDSDKSFNPTTIIAFGYHFESKSLREISENIKSYANKKSIDIDFITRY